MTIKKKEAADRRSFLDGPVSSANVLDFLRAVTDDARLHSLWLNTLSFLEYIGARKIAKALPQELFDERLLEHFSEEAQHSFYFKTLARKVRCEEAARPTAAAKADGAEISEPEEGGGDPGGGGSPGGGGGKEQRAQAAEGAEAAAASADAPSDAGGGWNPGFKEEDLMSRRAARDYFQDLDDKAKELSGKENPILNYLLSSCVVERRALGVYSVYNRLLKEKGFSFNLDPVLKDEKRHWIAMRGEIERLQHQDRLAALIRFEETVFPVFLRRLQRGLQRKIPAQIRGISKERTQPAF